MGGVEQQKLSVLVVGSLKSPGQWGLPLGDLGGRVRLGVFQLLMASCFLAHGLLAQSFTGHSQYLFTWPSPGAGLCLCPKDTSPTGLQATLMTSSPRHYICRDRPSKSREAINTPLGKAVQLICECADLLKLHDTQQAQPNL